MKHILAILKLSMIAMLSVFSQQITACTEFLVPAKDGTRIITRTMEFTGDLKSNLRSSPRGRKFATTAPDGKPGLSWTSKYGYIYLDGMEQDFAVDGMNEQGLSFGALLLPGMAKYQTVGPNQNDIALPYMNIGDWALSNFKTVAEVRDALPKIVLFLQNVGGLGDIVFPLHFSFYDAEGNGLVAEYIDGKLYMHDNIIGVLTNCPAYDWHITNLDNYVYLKPVNPKPVLAKGITFTSTGQGGGMLGLPGDITPPSRFVKMAVFKSVVYPATNNAEALNLAVHMINNVDIPVGLVREPKDGKVSTESTQWTVFKDLTNKVFYYRTYSDQSLREVKVSKIDFSPNAPMHKMSIANKQNVVDMTDKFIKPAASNG